MRIVKLEVENVKKLRAIAITPTSAVTQIRGANGSGKTSCLDAVFMAFGGKEAVPSQPVRAGEQKARIRLDLGEIVVTRRFDRSGTTSVRVEAADGAQYPSPQRLLDSLYSSLTFDPLAFTRLAPREQLETLRKVVQLDVDIDALDAANERDYRLRADWNHRAKSFAERVATVRESVNPDADVSAVDASALLTQMQEAAEFNNRVRQLNTDRRDRRVEIDNARQDARALREEAEEMLRNAEAKERWATAQAEELAEMPPVPALVDVAELRRRIDDATARNAASDRESRNRASLAAAERELAEAQRNAQELTAKMDERTALKRSAITDAAMPVPGLSFGAGEVLFDDVPLSQASTAEQIRVSFALAMAANPKLKVVLIKDGSLLDDVSLALIAEMAEANGYQVLLEKVGTDGSVGVLLENGEVVSVDGEPVEAAEVAQV